MTFFLWLERFGAQTGRAALSFSLLIGGFAWAVDYREISRRLHSAPNEDAKRHILKEVYDDPSIDRELAASLGDFVDGESYAITVSQAERLIEIRAFAENRSQVRSNRSLGESAKKIKQNPLYRDPGDKEESNWFTKGFESLGTMISRWLESLFNRQRNVSGPDISGINLSWLQPLFWGILGAILLFFLYFVFRHFSWKQGLERKAKAMLAEDEPELSRDEYLVEAENLVGHGKYREAVRCLYLASLLAFDEAGIARFVRGQTNWEHLRRIEASEKMPTDLDFQPATQKFDVVWYGMRVNGMEDVGAMRFWYEQVIERVRKKAA